MSKQQNKLRHEEATQTERELVVDLLDKLKHVAGALVDTKFCTKTDANMLFKAFSNIQLRVNQSQQGNLFKQI